MDTRRDRRILIDGRATEALRWLRAWRGFFAHERTMEWGIR
jgi:hypothetical protein